MTCIHHEALDTKESEQALSAPPLLQYIKGAILGFVIGDALGVPAEFMERSELKEHPIADMVGGGAHDQLPGTWSDDTSMVLCTMDSLLHNGVNYDDQMKRFSDWLWNASNTARDEVFDVGNATKSSIFKYVKGTPAVACGELSDFGCGNGSLMRILPTALYIIGQYGNTQLDDQAVDIIHNTSKCTHAHPRCQMACGVYCSVVFHLYNAPDLLPAVKTGINAALAYYKNKESFAEVYDDFESLRHIESWTENQIQSTGYVLHTLQAALWCLLTTDTYADCVLKAVNLGRDTDTTAAVAGGLAGFWYGANTIPSDWIAVTAKYQEIESKCLDFSGICSNHSRIRNKN